MDILRTGPIRKISPAERAHIQTSLDEVRRRASDLVFALNSTNPAVMLPEELLVHIFLIIRATYPQRPVADPWTGLAHITDSDAGIYGWTAVTHVCSRWRNIALGAPALWTKPWVTSLGVTQALLERSGSMPLDVEGLIPPKVPRKLSKAWRAVFRQARRIQSLKIEYLYDKSTKTAQWLEDVTPTFAGAKALFIRMAPNSSGLPWVLEDLYFRKHLEMLRLHAVTFDTVTSLLTPSLQHMELSSLGYASRNAVDALTEWKDLLRILKEVPSLKTLHLIDSLPPSPLATSSNIDNLPLILDNPVDLRSLTRLQVRSGLSIRRPGLFIHNLSLPPCATLRLYSESLDLRSAEKRLLGSILAKRAEAACNAVPSQPLRTLVFYTFHEPSNTRTEARTLSVAGWKQKLCLLTEPLPATYPAFLTSEPCLFEASVRHCTEEHIFRENIPLLPLQSLECIALGIDRPKKSIDNDLPSGQLMQEVFATAVKVDTLVIQGGGWALLLPEALCPSGDGSMLFPELKTLHLIETAFPDYRWNEKPYLRGAFWGSLVGTLHARASHGRKLETISIMRAGDVKEEEAGMLRTCARELVWDEWEKYDTRNWGWGRADLDDSDGGFTTDDEGLPES